jgi:hypothetical protein
MVTALAMSDAIAPPGVTNAAYGWSASTVIGGGHVMVGAVVSTIVIDDVQELVFPDASVAV